MAEQDLLIQIANDIGRLQASVEELCERLDRNDARHSKTETIILGDGTNPGLAPRIIAMETHVRRLVKMQGDERKAKISAAASIVGAVISVVGGAVLAMLGIGNK